jgi:peptidoglycan-N-acetylglucosamine deacetylase
MRRIRQNGLRFVFRIALSMLAALWLMLEPGMYGLQLNNGSGAGGTVYAAEGNAAVYGRLSSGVKVEREQTYVGPTVPTVYLTFDDGPSKLTGQVLDILKQEQAPSTFFVVGELAEERKELIKRMSEEGHEIGNHTYNHVYKDLYTDFGTFWEQAVHTDQLLEGITGKKPYLLRAPGGTSGNFDPFYFYLLEKAGYSVMDWNVDSRDAVRKGVKAEEIVEEIRRSPLKQELVVLMHDGAGHEETVKALPGIINFYREKGYAFEALGEDVKPVQFRLSPAKWSRSYTREGFHTAAAAADAAFAERGTLLAQDMKSEERLAEQVASAAEEAAEALRLRESMAAAAPLHIGMGASGGDWSLLPEQYSFENNRFSVPLRTLAERMGGKVHWDEAKRLASIEYGALRLEVDPVRRIIREQRPGQKAVTRYMADVAWVDGEIRVPLRATVNLFGGLVASYALEERERRIELVIGPDPGKAAWLFAVRDWKRQLFS